MPSSIWSGYLTFGLISIPVKLFPAARGEHVGFNMLHEECGTRIKQQLYCPTHDRVVSRDEIVKGYEYEKNRYITIDPKDIKKIEPATARAMEILEFVPKKEVDPLLFDASYYLVPDEAGRRAYVLLKQALEDTDKYGVARVSMHNREYTVIIRALEKGIAVHSMYFSNEVRSIEDMGAVDGLEVREKELELAHSLVNSLTTEFDLDKYHDTFQENLKKMLEAKLAGEKVEEVPKPKLAPVIDLMAALKKSLEEAKKVPRKPVSAVTEAERAAEHKPKRKAAKRKKA